MLAGIIVYGIVGFLIFMVWRIMLPPNPNKPTKWDRDIDDYKKTLEKLPSDLIERILKATARSIMECGLGQEYMSDEMAKIMSSANAVKASGHFGHLTAEQRSAVSSKISEYESGLEFSTMSVRIALGKATPSEGLGFGIITNNAADAMLYTAMNTNEQIKNYKKDIKAMQSILDNDVRKLHSALKSVLSEMKAETKMLEDLEKLVRLHESGALSDSEFSQAKVALLMKK